MYFFKKFIHILSNIVYFLIFIYGILCIPYIRGFKPLVVLTGSMTPTYKEGSIIYYKEIPEEFLKEGDVITFKYENLIITHRINEIKGNEYFTKGDANNAPDPKPITYKNILGKVSKIYIPYLGYYVSFINKHIYILAVVVLILVSEFLLSRVKTLDINKRRKDEKNGL